MFKEWKKLTNKSLKIVDAFIGLIVVGLTVFLILYRKHIPEEVPQHWNAAGEIDDYAAAGSYIMLVILMYFFYGWHQLSKVLTIFGWKESVFGKEKMGRVSEELERKAYNTLLWMLWGCDLLIQLILAYIVICGVFVRNLGVWFLPLSFILLIAIFAWFGVRIVQIKGKVR